MPKVIDFGNLGYHVRQKRSPVTQAARNTTAFFLNPYIAQDKLISPAKAAELYGRCNAVLSRLMDAAGVKRSKIKLWIVEEDQPNAWLFRDTGDLCLTTSLLEKEDLTDGEFASVLAHELGHYLKYKPQRKFPERFKNPLFREYAQGTAFAQRQHEEFEGDELGLLILDRAGFSVHEALNMAEWQAENIHENGFTPREGTKVLRPGASHPHMASRIGTIRANINHPKFVWKNRNAPKIELLDVGVTKEIKNETLRKQDDLSISINAVAKNLDALEISTINEIAQGIEFAESSMVFHLYKFLTEQDIGPRERTKSFVLKLKKQIEKGDIVSRAYLQALLCKVYFEAVKEKHAPAELEWLDRECDTKSEEVMLALLAFIENSESVYLNYLKALRMESPEHPFTNLSLTKRSLEEIIHPFSRSGLRDQLIAGLLRVPDLIADQGNYVEVNYNKQLLEFPLNSEGLRIDWLVKLLQLFHGTSIIDVLDIANYLSLISAKYEQMEYYESDEKVLPLLAGYVTETAGPYDRAELESALEKNINLAKATHSLYSSYRGVVQDSYDIKERAESFEDDFLKERVSKFGRIVLLRYLEAIPAEEWEKETIKLIEDMPISSEKNHLLILLHKAGKRKLKDTDFSFEDIPRPDEADAYGANLTLLNSFGFIDPHAAEAIYPSGQKVLDRFKAESLPEEGPLTLNQVCKAIPRPSPGRDELLDRIPAKGTKQARAVLDSYWSPAAAYAKAYQIAKSWMENLKDGDPKVFAAICKITKEFPSLRRRMAREWTDRFGISRDEYSKVLSAGSDVDIVDVYRGGIIEHSRGQSLLAKTAICLASFASALSRDKFSLISFQEIGERISEGRLPFAEEPDDTEEEKEIKKAEEAYISRQEIFRDYRPFLPENSAAIAQTLLKGIPFSLHSIPFVDDKPFPNPRFERGSPTTAALSEMKKWEGGRLFSNFMQAMGWEEAVAFYEEIFLGREGIAQNPDLLKQLENIFIQGIGLLLQEKNVPLARVETVKNGIQSLLSNQPLDIRAQVWTRILAGIAQKQSLGEITREAVRPLKAAGGKLMQAIHSLTAGVDPTLEEASRLALDQTASLSLLDGIQFLAFRQPESPFDKHQKYTLLGQGTVRSALGGLEGPAPEEAFLLVHAGPSDERVINGIANFIGQTVREGRYFPLTRNQFEGLVEQTEEERKRGFDNHIRYGELFNWKLGQVSIPKVLKHYDDWARVELVAGIPYTALEKDKKKPAAEKIIDAAFAQFTKTTSEGNFLINPEFHFGNLLIGRDGSIWLVDCGLIGEVSQQDLLSLFGLLGAFRSHGLPGAAASLFKQKNITNLAEIGNRESFVKSLRTMSGQVDAGTPPELLLPALAGIVQKANGPEVTSGLETLFRAVQHLAPYIREIGKTPMQFSSMIPQLDISTLASEIQNAMKGPKEGTTNIIPKGIAVGRKLKSGAIHQIGVLIDDVNLDESLYPGMVKCSVEGLTQYIQLEDLMIQKGNKWVSLPDFRK